MLAGGDVLPLSSLKVSVQYSLPPTSPPLVHIVQVSFVLAGGAVLPLSSLLPEVRQYVFSIRSVCHPEPEPVNPDTKETTSHTTSTETSAAASTGTGSGGNTAGGGVAAGAGQGTGTHGGSGGNGGGSERSGSLWEDERLLSYRLRRRDTGGMGQAAEGEAATACVPVDVQVDPFDPAVWFQDKVGCVERGGARCSGRGRGRGGREEKEVRGNKEEAIQYCEAGDCVTLRKAFGKRRAGRWGQGWREEAVIG